MKPKSKKFNKKFIFSIFSPAKKACARKKKVLVKSRIGLKKRRTPVKSPVVYGLFAKPLLWMTAVVLLCTMSAMLLRGIGGTVAYLSDLESSINNEFIAGNLDFVLDSQVSTSSICATTRHPLEKTISITNLGNPFKYQIGAGNFSSPVCDYIRLNASLGGELKYSGLAKDFDYGLTAFSDPTAWDFVLSVSSSTPVLLQGQICEFTFDFQGAQTRHNLSFPTGFSDFENSPTSIQAPFCQKYETRSMGYWKTHPEMYLPLLPQFLGATTTDGFGHATGTYETINTQAKVNKIFNADDSIMRNKLKKQLLAMKFNIMKFHIDNYIPASGTDNMDAIVAQADWLLRQDPEPLPAELEAIKNLLEGVNILESFIFCDSCEPPPPPDTCAMKLTKTADKNEAATGDEIIYHLTLDNYGTKVCTGSGVLLRDIYPSTLSYTSHTSNRKPNEIHNYSGYIEWNFGNIYPDDPLIEIDLKMKVKDQTSRGGVQCDSIITNSAKYWSNQTDWSALVSATSTIVCPVPETPKVVINEFLPNPIGPDSAHKPGGEWVELYNMGSSSVDVAGWALYDEADLHKLLISSANTDSGSTTIAAGGFLVVYRNGDSDFTLDNTGGDSIRLFNGNISDGANLIDLYVYTEDAPEGKSFARIPDGSSNWIDPIPTPGEENSLIGAYDFFGPAIPEEGEDGYIAFEPEPTLTGSSGIGADSGIIEPTATSSEPVAEIIVNDIPSQTATSAPANIETSETIPAEEPTTPIEESVVIPEPVEEPVTPAEEPASSENSNDTILINQANAITPPEIIMPEAPAVTDSGSGS